MFRFLTCGESHGKMLAAIIEGIPAGLALLEDDINLDLCRRQKGYGRGERSTKIETDTVQFIAGVRWGQTTGAPIGLLIENKDWKNRPKEMSISPKDANSSPAITCPRPGHADLPGMLKYGFSDAKPILERASARNTATLVAVGSICKKFLEEFGVEVCGYVKSIGDIEINSAKISDIKTFRKKIESSDVRCPDAAKSKEMVQLIDITKKAGDTLGGKVCVNIFGVVPGIGSHIEYDRRLDAALAQVMMGIPSVKEVLIGDENISHVSGKNAHDEIIFSDGKFSRKTNNAGGIEGGISNGETIKLTIGLKPIPTLYKPLKSVDFLTKKSAKAEIVRSDVAVAPSAVVVAEAMACIKLSEFYLDKFGGDNILETKRNFKAVASKKF